MQKVEICQCSHGKELHIPFGGDEYKPCAFGYKELSNGGRMPYQFMVCCCSEFKPDNLLYLEELANAKD